MAIDVQTLYDYATTALAAYVPRTTDVNVYMDRLIREGLADARTAKFISEFHVIDYFSDGIGTDSIGVTGLGQGTGLPSFASATVFERVSTGERILAIRGTNNPLDWSTDLVSIFSLGSTKYQFQYSILKEKVIDWIAHGVLRPGFTVTGHSLGGFLAVALTADIGPEISHSYLYNTPGYGGFQFFGISTNLTDWLASLRPDLRVPDASKITNITAKGGSSLISTLGIPVGDRADIAIETERLSSLNLLELWNSHKIEILTDALAVYDLLATVDPSVSIADSTKIVEASSSDNRASLERVVKALALVFGTTVPAPVESRDLLFSQINEIKDALTARGNGGESDIVPLTDKTVTQIVGLAQNDISVRYALKQLDSFALSGNEDLFAPFNADGELDIVGDDESDGTLTREWIADRAELLLAQSFVNTFEDGNTIYRQFGAGKDLILIQPGLDPQTIRVVGAEGARPPINTPQIIFGSDQSDTLRGLDAADHLYGESGDDSISGGKGDDYLEAGAGNDDLNGGPGSDHLVGGSGDDSLEGGAGTNRLEGGAGVDTYVMHRGEGNQVITDSDGLGQILLDGAALGGGHAVRLGRYESDDGHVYTFDGNLGESGALIIDDAIEITNFHNGALGITLVAGDDTPEQPAAGGSRLYLDHIFDLDNRDKPSDIAQFPYGSPADDTFIAGSTSAPRFLGFAGSDLIIGGGKGTPFLLGGAGDDIIENRVSTPDPEETHPLPIMLAGEAGRDLLIGSADDESLFGDFFWILLSPPQMLNRINVDAIEIFGDANTPAQSQYGRFDFGAPPGNTALYRDYPGGVTAALTVLVGYSIADLPDDAFDDTIDAGAGDDFVVGGAGNDTILGGEGNDRLIGDLCNRDPYHLAWIDTDDPRFAQYLGFFGQPGDDYIDGGDGDDVIQDIGGFSGTAVGGPGDDQISIVLDGDPDSDRDRVAFLDGGDDDDILYAEAPFGAILVEAGAGDDTIIASGSLAYLDGGTGNDTYEVYGLDITIHDDGDTDTLTFHTGRDEFYFSQDGDDLVIGSWFDLEDADMVGPDGEQWAQAMLVIEDWFAGSRHRIEWIILAPHDGEETEWTPDDIAAALDAGGLAWTDFIQPDEPAFVPFELPPLEVTSAPPAQETPPPESSSDPPPEPQPEPPPVTPPATPPQPPPQPPPEPEPEPEPLPVTPPATPHHSPPPAADNAARSPTPPEVIPTSVRIAITDPGFYGLLAGTAFADAFTVLSERGVVIDAGAGDDNITTGGGSDEIRPGPGSDTVSAGGGDDRIIVNRFEGEKQIDGGTGIDILSIDRSIGSISGRLEDGKIVIYDAKGGSLSAANVNIYEFADALYVQAGTQPEAVVAWMYKTWLGHTPDAKGMQYWLDQVAAGRPLADMERGFANAIKTTSLYTDTSDEEFLDGLYARAFDPATDLPERSFWLQQLQTGAMTRDQVITDLVALEEAQVTITGVVLIPGTL